MDIKAKMTVFWTDMQAWVGLSPVKSTVLAVACGVAGWLLHALLT